MGEGEEKKESLQEKGRTGKKGRETVSRRQRGQDRGKIERHTAGGEKDMIQGE